MTSSDSHKHRDSALLLITALGIVYGDIGTSPLYAIREAFHGPHAIPLSIPNIYGVLSLITWALLFIVSFKYIQFVMRADNDGEGGILALTALAVMQKGKTFLGKNFFLHLGLFGAALMVGDCIITPSISVLSAVEGIEVATPALSHFIIPVTYLILTVLFYFQKKGTEKIGVYFGPIMLVWFFTIAILGALSVIETPNILQSLNPLHAFRFWMENPTLAFTAMGAVFLVVTGGEALYADMGHLSRESISQGWFYIALPSLLLNYYGQGALLLRSPESVSNPFYRMAPEWLLIPLVLIATLATIIASQAVISGFFSLASQCVQLGYAPRLKIDHTSEKTRGQIYIPAVNWAAFAGTLWLVLEFRNSSSLASAYGISVSLTMVITTLLTYIVAINTWNWGLGKALTLFSAFAVVDILFVSANLMKLEDGGWVPIMIAIAMFILVTTWKKGRSILFERLRARSYPFQDLLEDVKRLKPAKVPGTAVFMIGDADVTPPTLLHNLKHNKVLHETVVFLTIVNEGVAYVPEKDKVQITKIADGFFKVTGHYGFKETPKVMNILSRCEGMMPGFLAHEATFFLGREILVAGQGREMLFWRKIIFSVMARNATSANSYFELPLDRVIEVGMQIEL